MPALRQVGVVDAVGRVAAMTGDLCIGYAGDVAGDGFTVQANMMASPDVWPAMAAAYTDSTGPPRTASSTRWPPAKRPVATRAAACRPRSWSSRDPRRHSREVARS